MAKKYWIGFLLLVVLSTSIYVMLPEKIRIDVQRTRTQYRVYESDSWVFSATEYVNLFDGTKKMRAKNRSLYWYNASGIIVINRKANYKDNISTFEMYVFDSTKPNVELVPTSHEVICLNCVGKILHFEYRDILYTGETKEITSPFSFGHNMKLTFQDGYYRAKVYQQKYASDKIIIRYRPKTNYKSFLIRLFDPEPTNETPINETPEYNETHEYIYEPESKTWIIRKKPFRGGGGDIEPEESKIESTITYAPTKETQCNGNTCSLVLYSGIRFVEEDNKWKGIEEARSLKGKGFKIVKLEDDEDFTLNVIDFNYTSIEMDSVFNGNPLDHLDSCDYKSEEEFKCQFKNVIKWIDDEDVEQTLKYDLKYEMKDGVIVANNTKFSYKGNPFGKEYTFGGNSTTIQLQTAETENLGDGTISQEDPDDERGGDDEIFLINDDNTIRDYHILIKWNISSIPANSIITDSKLGLYICDNWLDDATEGYNVSSHLVYSNYTVDNLEWDEGDSGVWALADDGEINWNEKPDNISDSYYNTSGSDDIKFFGGIGEPTNWTYWSVTPSISYAYINNYTNVTIWLKSHSVFGEPGNGDIVDIWSKEYVTDITLRPYLNITYTEAEGEDTTSPSFSSFLNNASSDTINGTDVQLNATIKDVSNVSAYTLSTNDTSGYSWANETIIDLAGDSNVTMVWNHTISFFSNGGTFGWKVWANDTINNSGESSTQTFFVYEKENPNSNITSNDTSPKINGVVNISLNVSDNLELDYCWFYNNMSGVNSSLISISGTSDHSLCYNISIITVSQGNDILFIGYVNDTSGNLNSSQTTITVSNTAPDQPTISFPVTGKNYSDIGLNINFTANDDDSDSLTYTLYVNNTINVTGISTNVTDWNASDGYYNLTVTANDGTDSSVNSSVVIFRIDTVASIVSLIAPANNSAWDIDNTPDFNFSASDNIAIANCTLYINDTFNKSQTTNANFTDNPVGNGSYEWFVNCSDAVPNWGYSGFFNLEINYTPPDTIPPTYSNWQNNASSMTYPDRDINFSITMTDNLELNSYFFAHNQSGTMTNVTNGTMTGTSHFFNYTFNITLSANNFICAEMSFDDTNGNANLTNQSCFTVQAIPPAYFYNYLNSVNTSRTYEYETTVNISVNVSSIGTTYVDILDDTKRYRNQSSSFNYTINLLRINEFNDNITSKNISSENQATISIDNRTDLYNASFNITGYPIGSLCYQETANVSTNCGALGTGVYYGHNDTCGSGIWQNASDVLNYPTHTYDGDYYSYAYCNGNQGYIYVNYSKPSNALSSSSWQIKDADGTVNLSINTTCWDFSTSLIALRMQSDGTNGDTYFHCWNSTDWMLIQKDTTNSYLYEEAMWWNLSRHPNDLVLNYTNIFNFPGALIKNDLYQDEFIFSGVSYDKLNLSYTTAGSKIIYVNFSNRGDLTRTGYFNFTVTAFDLDKGNDFDFYDNFSNSLFINLSSLKNVSSPLFVYDDFENNATADRYDMSDCGGTTKFTGGYYQIESDAANGNTNDCNGIFNQMPLDNLTILNFTINIGHDYAAGYPRGGSMTHYIKLTDETTEVTLFSESASFSTSSSDNPFYLWEMKKSGNNWDITRNGSGVGSASIAGLDSPIYLKFGQAVSASAGGNSMRAWWYIYEMKNSGIGLTRLTGKYENNVSDGTFESDINFTSANDITRILITVTENIPTGTSIDHFTSNDNGSTYESFTPGTYHTFTSTGKNPEVKFVLNSTVNISSPSIQNYRIQIIPAPPEGLWIDVGNDDIYDMNLSYVLNSSTTPINFTGNDSGINDYINDSCLGLPYCSIPITFLLGSGGIIQIDSFNLTKNINPISLNTSPIQTLKDILIKPTYTSGIVQFDDIQFDFRGSKNITVVAHVGNYSTSLNRTVFVKYSPFNLSFNADVDYFEVFYTSRNQSNAEPYGQNSTHGIFKIESEAYDGNISIYARYNASPHACLTAQELRGQDFLVSSNNSLSTLNITNLTTSNQLLVSDLNDTSWANIRAYSTVNCSPYNITFIPFEYFCFNSLDSKAVLTQDWQDSCDVMV